MTTIAYCKGVLAFDSKATASGVHHGSMVKGKKTGKFLIAGCGAAEDVQAFMDWIEAGGNAADKKAFGLDRECDMSALAINKKGMVFHYDGRLYPFVLDADFFALGSGAEFALGAMAFGASAVQAVRIAAKFDTATGGTVRELRWKR